MSKRITIVEYPDVYKVNGFENKNQAFVFCFKNCAQDIPNHEEDFTPEGIAMDIMDLLEKDRMDDYIYLLGVDYDGDSIYVEYKEDCE